MANNKNSDSMEQWFDECPVAMLILDDSGRIRRINRALEEMLGINAGELVGHDAETLPRGGLQVLFDGTGELHIPEADNSGRRYRCLARELSGDGGLVLHCYQDITELLSLQEQNDRLQQQIDELAITDELTGMANNRSLSRVLGAQVTRSRRYQNPLSLAVVEIALGDSDKKPSDEVILAVSRFLRDRLRWVDVIARWSHDQFVLVLPETTIDDGQRLLNKIKQGFSDSELLDEISQQAVRLYIGLAEWQKGNDARHLMKRAMETLAAEKEADMSLPA
jgi:diguanylate cyclase (GGDEF)-like protein